MSSDHAAHFDEPIPARPLWRSLLKLARPAQWSKSAFVLIGPFYALRSFTPEQLAAGAWVDVLLPALVAAIAFAAASSGCYVINDLADRVADRSHPRKRKRPIAAGHVSPGLARVYAAALFAIAGGCVFLAPAGTRPWLGLALGIYIANVMVYSAFLKHYTIADVISLSMGFVLRVMGGCAAAAVEPSSWLLNVVFFLSMFLAFGKRLGERKTLAGAPGASDASRAVAHRRVQAKYTDVMLQMTVVVTAGATLLTYALYVQSEATGYVLGFNLMWLTVIPATYGLLRCIVVLERGLYDDPTELAVHDWPFQLAGIAFVGLTVGVMALFAFVI
ncbi:MAG: UbiA family prenyltransferase [Planctomycetota bacterium]